MGILNKVTEGMRKQNVVRRSFGVVPSATQSRLAKILAESKLPSDESNNLKTVIFSGPDTAGAFLAITEALDNNDLGEILDIHATSQASRCAFVAIVSDPNNRLSLSDSGNWKVDASSPAEAIDVLLGAPKEPKPSEPKEPKPSEWLLSCAPARSLKRGAPNYPTSGARCYEVISSDGLGILAKTADFFAKKDYWIKELNSSVIDDDGGATQCRIAISVFNKDGESPSCEELAEHLRDVTNESSLGGAPRVAPLDAISGSAVFEGSLTADSGDFAVGVVAEPRTGLVRDVAAQLAENGLSMTGSLMSISGGQTIIAGVARSTNPAITSKGLIASLSRVLKERGAVENTKSDRSDPAYIWVSDLIRSEEKSRKVLPRTFTVRAEIETHREINAVLQRLSSKALLVSRWVMEPIVGRTKLTTLIVVGTDEQIMAFQAETPFYTWKRSTTGVQTATVVSISDLTSGIYSSR